MLVAKEHYSKEEIAGKKIAVPGEMTSAFLALQLWLGRPKTEIDYVVVPFDEIFATVKTGQADVGLIIHEGQLTFENEGLVCCMNLGVWWGEENDGLPLPLGGNVIHKRIEAERKVVSDLLTESIQYSLDHRPEAVEHALQYARDMGVELADQFVGMYVNHWTLDYGDNGRDTITRFLGRAHEAGLIRTGKNWNLWHDEIPTIRKNRFRDARVLLWRHALSAQVERHRMERGAR